MHAVDVYLAILNPHKRLLNAAFSHADGLYLSPIKLNARLVLVVNKVIVVCLFIIGPLI